MSTWHALQYPIKPGSEEAVKELFRTSGRPNFEITSPDGKVVGRLNTHEATKEQVLSMIIVGGAEDGDDPAAKSLIDTIL